MRTTRMITGALATVALVAVCVVGAAAQSTATPTALETPPVGTFTITPFARPGTDACWLDDPVCLAACDATSTPSPVLDASPATGCTTSHPDDSIRITFTIPEGWYTHGVGIYPPAGYGPPRGQAIHLVRGGWMFTDPCLTQARWDAGEGFPDIVVGPTVDDFVDALTVHPAWESSTPVDVTLGGWSGKYLDIELPADVEGCMFYPWANGYYAQGPSDRWRLWVLDVDGVRVVIQAADFEDVPAQDLAEKLAVVHSIRIES